MPNVKFCVIALAAVSLCGQTKKIVVVNQSPATVRELQAAAGGAARVVLATPDTLMSEITDADAILGTISPELIKAGKNLKWVQIYSAGVENYRSDELLSSRIVLTNAKILQGPNIADHAMALLLTFTRHIDQAVLGRATQQWTPKAFPAIELNGKTGVVIGVGGIGTQIAVRASAFGMRIIGVDPKDIPYMPALSKVVPPDRLDTVIPEADVVFISVPDSPKSRGMFGERQFELMKKGSYFIAVSRGKIYSSSGLVKALASGKLSGAGLDVTDPEPLPPDHPLWRFPNCIITPHIATASDNFAARRLTLLKENVHRFVNGEPLLNQVDKDKGY